MSTNRRSLETHAAGFLAFATSLVGCFASPNYSQITCKTDKQCPPSFQCDLSKNKCTAVTDAASIDAASINEAGPAFRDVSGEHSGANDDVKEIEREIGGPWDGSVSADLPGLDLPLTPDLATDVSSAQDTPFADALPLPDISFDRRSADTGPSLGAPGG
jgi:hypothetical protein